MSDETINPLKYPIEEALLKKNSQTFQCNGETGSPCLNPLCKLNSLVGDPLIRTAIFGIGKTLIN
jgi:hypothetical protein